MIRIYWEYSFGNNLYHYVIAKILSEKFNLKLSYVDESRYTRSDDPSKSHAKILTDPLEYFKLLKINISYLPEKKENFVLLNNASQLHPNHIDLSKEYILTRKNSWMFFDEKEVEKKLLQLRKTAHNSHKQNSKDLVVHARLGEDFYRKGRVPNFEKIKSMMNTIEYDKIFICTDSPGDSYIDNFRKTGKDVIVRSKKTRRCDPKTGYFLNEVGSNLIIDDFNFIRSFDKILLTSTCSTFSFLSAATSLASTVLFDIEESKQRKWFLHEMF